MWKAEFTHQWTHSKWQLILTNPFPTETKTRKKLNKICNYQKKVLLTWRKGKSQKNYIFMLCLYRGTSNWMFTVVKYFSTIRYDLNRFCKCVKRSKHYYYIFLHISNRCRRGRDRIVVGFITTHAISAYHQ